MRDYLWCMSLLEWLKFWSKFYRIPLFWNSEYPSENENCQSPSPTVSEYPPENENCQSESDSFRIPSPPPENWNLGRSWHFKTFQFQNTPPPENWNLGRSWHFKTFQFQKTMCVKLPQVETLSSPDNYSFTFVTQFSKNNINMKRVKNGHGLQILLQT